MTTGRINQVAFFVDVGIERTFTIRPRCHHEHDNHSYRAPQLNLDAVKGIKPHVHFAFRIQENKQPRHGPQRPRHCRGRAEHIHCLVVHRAPQRGTDRKEQHDVTIPSSRYQAQEPIDSPKLASSLRHNNDEENALAVRCTSTEPTNARNYNTTHMPARELGHGATKRATTHRHNAESTRQHLMEPSPPPLNMPRIT